MTSLTVVSNRNNERIIIVIVILVLSIIRSGLCDKYQMNQHCNKGIYFSYERVNQLKLELTQPASFAHTMTYTCETNITGSYKYPKLMFYFEKLNLDCRDGHLEFYERHGKTGDTRVFGLEGDICGKNKSEEVYAVDTGYIRIKYVTTRKQFHSYIFGITITAFTDEPCKSYAKKCINSRCVDKDVACNGYSPCVNGSWCDNNTSNTDSLNKVAAFVIGFVVPGGCFICTIVWVCCNHKSARPPGEVQNTGQTRVAYTSSSQHTCSQASSEANTGATTCAYQTERFCQASNDVNHDTFQTQERSSSTSQPIYYVPTNVTPAQHQTDSFSNYGPPPAYADLFGPLDQGAK